MSWKKPALFGIAMLLCGFVPGYFLGNSNGGFQAALTLNKIAAVNLHNTNANLSPDLRDYLRAQMYFNIRKYYPNDPGYLIRKDWDFGPVDRSNVRFDMSKGPETAAWNWEEAVANK